MIGRPRKWPSLRVVSPLSIDPAAAGLTVDAKATVAAGGRRHATPAGLWRDLFAHHSLQPVLAVDTAKLDAAVTALDSKIVGGGHDGGIEFQRHNADRRSRPCRESRIVHDKAVAAIRGRVPHVDRAGHLAGEVGAAERDCR